MANFKPDILKDINAIEGGWVDDPDDAGRETWRGFARAFNPKSKVWPIVDDIKRRNPIFTAQAYAGKPKSLNNLLYANKEINDIIDAVYQRDYFDVNRLGEIIDQQIARNVCDCGVNCGVFTGARMLQRAYNRLKGVRPIGTDGKIGNGTLTAVNNDDPEAVYNSYNQLRKEYYDAIILRRPSQVKYKKSWYSRIKPYVA
jgi:lysozyme family protein